LVNLEKHLENTKLYNLDAVVAINRFVSDSDEELEIVRSRCEELGFKAVVSNVWGEGGAGAEDLAKAVIETIESTEKSFAPLYDWSLSIEEKIETVCTKVYGASGVEFTSQAKKDLRKIKKLGFEDFPVCIAKTQKSLSDDASKIGRPTDFVITVREIEIAAGAGFVVPITGEMMRMPGLPSIPASEHIDISDDGQISGLF
jgi:formate--tetrahydrofolate ligase